MSGPCFILKIQVSTYKIKTNPFAKYRFKCSLWWTLPDIALYILCVFYMFNITLTLTLQYFAI